MNRAFRVVMILTLLAASWAGTAFAIQVYTGPTELTGSVVQVYSGNSFALYDGTNTSVVVLEGIVTPKRGEKNFMKAANFLHKLLFQKKVRVAITRKARFITYGVVTELDNNLNVNARVLDQTFAVKESEVAAGGEEASLVLQGNRFHSAVTGFSITKPGDWVFLSAEDVAASRQDVRMEDRELEIAVKQRGDVPLLAIARHQEPYAGLNPSVTVMVKSVGGLLGGEPVALLQSTVPDLENAFSGFTIEDGPSPTTVDGRKAAYLKATYTITDASGKNYNTVSRIYLVPRGTVMFMMSFSTLVGQEAKVAGAFDEMLSSVKIGK